MVKRQLKFSQPIAYFESVISKGTHFHFNDEFTCFDGICKDTCIFVIFVS